LRERLNRRDWIFIGVCAAIFAASLLVGIRWFPSAFPEASIELKYDRNASLPLAEQVLQGERIRTGGMKHTAMFDADDNAKVFLERTLGLKKANAEMRGNVHVWFWHHRWFKPLQEEEYGVDIAPTGELVAFTHHIPEERALPTPDLAEARRIADDFLARNRIRIDDLQLVAQSERKLPHRIQRIFTWDSKSVRPGGAPYRHTVIVDGNAIGQYEQRVKVPEQWQRTYDELRSWNNLAGKIDTVFLAITIVAALIIFVVRLRRGDMRLKFLLGVAAVSILLSALVAVNNFPQALAGYDTTTSYGAFLAQFVFFNVILGSFGAAMLLVVITGAGEVLYRERLPQHLALPKLWTPRALTSKRVFRSFVLGYTLMGFFVAYQVVFYIVASRFGAWSPAEIPYDNILNTALPWVAVLFAGFFPAMSEEFLSRAFSIPFFQRVLKSRWAAIVAAGFIWGFGHATYPNQPFYIRGVEVGLAGVLIGFLMDSFGLLPLLIWHYTVDAVYTALLLFRSGNPYYIVSAGAASLVFVIPMLASIVLYIRNKGFLPDDDLTNATLPVEAPPAAPAEPPPRPELPPAIRPTPARIFACIAAAVIAAILLALRPPTPDDAVDYRIDRGKAKQLAAAHLRTADAKGTYERVIATTLDGFHSWDRNSRREEGGAPGPFDSIAATYLIHHGMTVEQLVGVFRTRVEAATWTVRFFTPMKKEEYFVEVDPRTSRVLGYHKYQAEQNPGARLEQAQALAVAMPAFARYGVDPAQFELKEALSFQQPNRRDWLFHFQERQALAADAWRRVTIRVAGAEVTQFTKSVKIPDVEYRQPTTLLNFVLTALKIAGLLAVFALIITGLVMSAIRKRFHWRRAARWTAMLAWIPIFLTLIQYEDSLFNYNTSIAWQTFTISMITSSVMLTAFRIALLFLALAAIETALPAALEVFSREGRARWGRAAALSALTALAIFAALRVVVVLVARLFPAAARVNGLGIPETVAIPLPFLAAVLDALFDAITVSAAIAMFVVAVQSLRKWSWLPDAITVTAIFFVLLDGNATPSEAPLLIVRALVGALAILAVVKWVLGTNALAYPVAIFVSTALQSALGMLANHRPDLQWSGMAVIAVVAAALLWIVAPRTADA
jgi:membrane protease YdiL (CAAX protease family)